MWKKWGNKAVEIFPPVRCWSIAGDGHNEEESLLRRKIDKLEAVDDCLIWVVCWLRYIGRGNTLLHSFKWGLWLVKHKFEIDWVDFVTLFASNRRECWAAVRGIFKRIFFWGLDKSSSIWDHCFEAKTSFLSSTQFYGGQISDVSSV